MQKKITVKKLIFVLLFFVCLSPVRAETVEGLVRLARDRNPSIALAKENLERARLSKLSFYTNYAPNLTLSLSRSRNIGNTSVYSSSRDSESYGLSGGISWTLFSGLSDYNDLKQLSLAYERAQHSYIISVLESDYTVKTACFDVLYAQASLVTGNISLKSANDELLFIKERFNLGLVSRIDVLKIEAQYANARLNLVRRNNQLAQARRSLNLILDLPPDSLIEIDRMRTEPSDIMPFSVYYERFMKSPKVKSIQADYEATLSQTRQSLSNFLPSATISLQSVYSDSEAPDELSNLWDNAQTEVSLNLRWNILSGGRNIINAKSSASQKRSATINHSNSLSSLENDLRNTYYALIEALSSLELARMQNESNSATLELAKEQFRLGEITTLELVTAEVNLMESDDMLLSTEKAYRASMARLELLAPKLD
jgi:outer membrane protein